MWHKGISWKEEKIPKETAKLGDFYAIWTKEDTFKER